MVNNYNDINILIYMIHYSILTQMPYYSYISYIVMTYNISNIYCIVNINKLLTYMLNKYYYYQLYIFIYDMIIKHANYCIIFIYLNSVNM